MLVRAGSALPRGSRGERRRSGWGTWQWTLAVLAVVGFVLAIQVATTAYGSGGPLRLLAADFFGRPAASEVKIAGFALAVICMPRRWCLPFTGAVLALEVLFNAVRLAGGESVAVGNGVVWALVGFTAFVALRTTGADRAAGLKAAGIAGILIVANHASAGYLELTMHALPQVADQFVEIADRALGSPSWVVGQFVQDHRAFRLLISVVYTYLSLGAAAVAYWQLRRCATDGFPGHHIVRSFIVIGAIGPIVYFLLPVVGPDYAFGDALHGAGWMNLWPHTVPTSLDPVSAGFSTAAPRNCMPSLHTAWATAILLNALRGPRLLKAFGIAWWALTLLATVGLGFHYGVDLVAGFVFAVTVEAALVRPEAGWHRRRIVTVAAGAVAFVAILLSIRYLSVPMAQSGPVAAVLLLGTAAAVALAYARIARSPSSDGALASPPERDRALAG